ncbi:oxidoreductase [Amycolatopsis acidicola]|uniref:Oxidoreductase n=1 Tax=Amycolatopsis acidicola TaxID=2596893 RepID=A0A5N0URG7_9PSEU|nr:PDR/VanB family oxidoreductase [Amycolatopsis acidicola]KAA9154191.1 oxidoreductase [Amycolatopsis acidicola]
MIVPPSPGLRRLARAAEHYHRWIISRSRDVRVRAVNRDLRLRVERVRREAEDVVSLRLANGSPLPTWRPGSHLDVHLPSGRRRQYSLCGDPADRFSYRIAVRRIGAGSAELHALTEGDELTVRGPRNAFPYAPADRSLFIAGGIGITPILPMVKAARGDWRLIYCGRSRDSLPFLDELPEDRVRIRTDDEHGVPDAAELLDGFDGSVYLCGPAPLLEAVRRTHHGPLHFERFAPPPVVDGRPFEVELARTGDVLPVPADASALSVVQERLPGVAYSCRQGFCGTCRVRVLAGEVDHRGGATFGHTEDSMLICVSRGTGRITLDL